ncbi:MAG: primosomal protein N' [Alphaproteobacteria bacterium]|nr:primosomal protein N' [Alphaproteobacteria bacterium]
MSTVSVLPIGPFNTAFSYKSEFELNVGDIVEVPFGRKSIIGIVTNEAPDETIELKSVTKKFGYNIGKVNYDFLEWVSSYTFIPRGQVLKMILCEKTVFSAKKNAEIKTQSIADSAPILLNEEQKSAYEKIMASANKPCLLHGVTGSGKTEVYLAVAKKIFEQKKQILILFPEIALTKQISDRIEKYFGFKPIIWNSGITPKHRREAWLKAISDEPCVIVGARSALFLPFRNLGLIIIDEEHDSSYKQEDGGFYNARDMAIVLGHLRNIPVILSSATPSLESYVNAKNNKYGYALLENRFGAAKIPPIHLIDMRQNKFDGFISPILLNNIKETIAREEQCLIYLNRRGYSPITLCKSCGEKITCPNCTSWLVYHKDSEKLICHYCGYKISTPKKCLSCGEEDSYIPFGSGVERIYDELQNKLPMARIQIVSSDTVNSEKNIEDLVNAIANHEVDIVVGTQILAKGHHFPNITLVGIVDGDLGLNGADLRAAEKTYQLINQVAGRAGREEKEGRIFIQTFNPEHSLYATLKSNNPFAFLNLEIESRRRNKLPPYSNFASLIISGTNKELTRKVAEQLRKTCPQGIKIFGPAPAPIFLLRGRVRWRILLQSTQKKSINSAIKKWIFSQKTPKNVKIQIDIDPITFL